MLPHHIFIDEEMSIKFSQYLKINIPAVFFIIFGYRHFLGMTWPAEAEQTNNEYAETFHLQIFE